jgi:hypothetical protein
MLPSNGMGNVDKPFYDNQSQWLRIGGFQATATAIQNPFTFYYVQNNDWSSSHSYQFWNKNFTTAVGTNNSATLKTIYSPSPSGFVEPQTAAFTSFTSTGSSATNGNQFNVSGSFNKGWNFYTNGWKTGNTIFFNALGFRDTESGRSGTGNIISINGCSSDWSVGASSTSLGLGVTCQISFVDPQNSYYRSCGHTCWPVKE